MYITSIQNAPSHHSSSSWQRKKKPPTPTWSKPKPKNIETVPFGGSRYLLTLFPFRPPSPTLRRLSALLGACGEPIAAPSTAIRRNPANGRAGRGGDGVYVSRGDAWLCRKKETCQVVFVFQRRKVNLFMEMFMCEKMWGWEVWLVVVMAMAMSLFYLNGFSLPRYSEASEDIRESRSDRLKHNKLDPIQKRQRSRNEDAEASGKQNHQRRSRVSEKLILFDDSPRKQENKSCKI